MHVSSYLRKFWGRILCCAVRVGGSRSCGSAMGFPFTQPAEGKSFLFMEFVCWPSCILLEIRKPICIRDFARNGSFLCFFFTPHALFHLSTFSCVWKRFYQSFTFVSLHAFVREVSQDARLNDLAYCALDFGDWHLSYRRKSWWWRTHTRYGGRRLWRRG